MSNKVQDKITSLETANFVILCLYREFSKALLSDNTSEEEKAFCKKQMNILRKDLQQTDKEQIINKARSYYGPLLRKITEKYKDE